MSCVLVQTTVTTAASTLDNINGASKLSSNWKSCRLCAMEKRRRPNRPCDEFERPHHDAHGWPASDRCSEENRSDDEWMHVERKEEGHNFGDLFLCLVYLRNLSAWSACVLSWWASKAGVSLSSSCPSFL